MPLPRVSLDKELCTLPLGSRGRIASMSVTDEMKQQLLSLGLLEGVEVRVVRQAPLGGAILVEVGTSEYALGREVASRIRIRLG